MVQTVIGINSAMMRTLEKNCRRKNHLAEVTEAMDFDDLEVDSLDEALDALDDAIDIITVSLDEED